jgi:hypothetical protein
MIRRINNVYYGRCVWEVTSPIWSSSTVQELLTKIKLYAPYAGLSSKVPYLELDVFILDSSVNKVRYRLFLQKHT